MQSDDAAELCRRIINYVGEITIECNEHGFEALRAGNHFGVFRVYWQVLSQPIHFVTGISQRLGD